MLNVFWVFFVVFALKTLLDVLSADEMRVDVVAVSVDRMFHVVVERKVQIPRKLQLFVGIMKVAEEGMLKGVAC